MTAPFAYPERVPQSAVERLQANFVNLTMVLRDMLNLVPPYTAEAALCKHAHGLLSKEHEALQSEAADFQRGSREALLEHASKLRLLARNLDGYTFTSVDEVLAEQFVQHRRLLVLTAWQIAAVASGSEAAGL